MERAERFWSTAGLYARTTAKWLAVAAVTGTLCGLIGSAFHIGVEHAAGLRGEHPWLLFCLPLAGLVIVALYKLLGAEGKGTNDVIDAVHLGKSLPLGLLPSIFAGTVLTHLCGGSAGREGAALQMGGALGYHTGRLLRLDDKDSRTATLCGMAAFFSALFGTPLAAAVFAIMVITVDVFYHVDFVPCFTAALVSYGISLRLGIEPTRFSVSVPEESVSGLLRAALLAALCAWVSVLFCETLHAVERQFSKRLPNPWVRAAAGGCGIAALTLLTGTADYNGAGMEVIAAAVERGTARPEAFLLKMLFTAVTLAAGFKGGEVVPSFFVGASFGCTAAPLLGLPPGFGAALGLVAVFCGVTNCPVASIFLALELFGGDGLLYFALACGISFMLSGYSGLYSSQIFSHSKLKAQYLNVHANAYRPADPAQERAAAERQDAAGRSAAAGE